MSEDLVAKLDAHKTRLTDDELTALLAAHRKPKNPLHFCCLNCGCEGDCKPDSAFAWPCETWRLAAEVRDLLKVARAIAKEPNELVSGAILEIARWYEEGGRS